MPCSRGVHRRAVRELDAEHLVPVPLRVEMDEPDRAVRFAHARTSGSAIEWSPPRTIGISACIDDLADRCLDRGVGPQGRRAAPGRHRSRRSAAPRRRRPPTRGAGRAGSSRRGWRAGRTGSRAVGDEIVGRRAHDRHVDARELERRPGCTGRRRRSAGPRSRASRRAGASARADRSCRDARTLEPPGTRASAARALGRCPVTAETKATLSSASSERRCARSRLPCAARRATARSRRSSRLVATRRPPRRGAARRRARRRQRCRSGRRPRPPGSPLCGPPPRRARPERASASSTGAPSGAKIGSARRRARARDHRQDRGVGLEQPPQHEAGRERQQCGEADEGTAAAGERDEAGCGDRADGEARHGDAFEEPEAARERSGRRREGRHRACAPRRRASSGRPRRQPGAGTRRRGSGGAAGMTRAACVGAGTFRTCAGTAGFARGARPAFDVALGLVRRARRAPRPGFRE